MTHADRPRPERIVLAYSGDLDTSVAISWLAERYRAEVIAVTLDLGQGYALEQVRDRALATGALRAHVLDVREEFAREYVLRSLRAGAMYEDRQPMTTSLGLPLIARKLVEIADIEEATAIAHGGTSPGNDAGRIDVMVRALNPVIQVIAPARDWGMTRSEAVAYARDRHVPMPATADRSHGADSNLWGRSIECGILEDPWTDPPDDVYTLTKSSRECPDEPAFVEIAFDQGVPTAINGVAMPLVDLIGSLTIIAGAHGVGRIDSVEDRLGGSKSRDAYEAPAAVVLHAAHRELQRLATTRDLDRFARGVSLQYANLLHEGLWFSPLREALDAFVDKVQERVTGTIGLRLCKGDYRIVGRRSSQALDDPEPGTNEAGDWNDQSAGVGFLTIGGLPAEMSARESPVSSREASGSILKT